MRANVVLFAKKVRFFWLFSVFGLCQVEWFYAGSLVFSKRGNCVAAGGKGIRNLGENWVNQKNRNGCEKVGQLGKSERLEKTGAIGEINAAEVASKGYLDDLSIRKSRSLSQWSWKAADREHASRRKDRFSSGNHTVSQSAVFIIRTSPCSVCSI